MRGKITDQDLTNYALNDGLEPNERLYVESMLGVSEECRQDVYRNLELSQMLETGFERIYGDSAPTLLPDQREALMHPPRRRFGLATAQRAAAILAMAACAALAIANPNLWQETHRVSKMMANSITAASDSGIAPLVTLPNLGVEVESIMQTAVEAMPQATAICTPPTLDTSDFVDFR